ncbi:MAG: cell division protein FtsA [Candidatus Paceibacterota bacterium]
MKELITSLDLGSKNIKALVALDRKEQPGFEILAKKKRPSKGIRKGAVEEPIALTERIKAIAQDIEQEMGQSADQVLVNISGSHLFCQESKGTIAVSRADQQISQKDIDRVIDAAKTFSLPSNQEILDVFPKEYVVDGEEKVGEPLGMKGVRLEANILAVCVFSPYRENLTKAVLDSGLEIKDIEPSSLASARAVLSDRQKERGAAVLDIGAWSTDLAVFEEKDLVHLAVFPIGSGHITNDLAIGLKTDIDLAEKIKKEYGTCKGSRGRGEKIEMEEDESVSFRENDIVKIVKPRAKEIFEQTHEQLKAISREDKLPGGVILTGGGSKLPGLAELAKDELELPVRTAAPEHEDLQDPAWSTVWGLTQRGFEINGDGPSFKNRLGSRLKKIFKVFVP